MSLIIMSTVGASSLSVFIKCYFLLERKIIRSERFQGRLGVIGRNAGDDVRVDARNPLSEGTGLQ